jgi:hypothetical protein
VTSEFYIWQNGVKSEARLCVHLTSRLMGRRRLPAQEGSSAGHRRPQWKHDIFSCAEADLIKTNRVAPVHFTIRKHLCTMSHSPEPFVGMAQKERDLRTA